MAFALLNLLPGNIAIAILGTNATPGAIAQLNRQLGLNRPFFVRYGSWLWQDLHGNFGTSFVTHESVLQTILPRVPVTLELVVFALLIALVCAVPAAVLAARRPGKTVDKILGTVSMVGLSMPNFVLALLLVLILGVRLRAFPTTGFIPLSAGLAPNLTTMLMPALSMSFVLFATYTRVLRGDMVEQLQSEEYVSTARAKGAGEWRVLVRHVLRNSALGMVTVVGTNFGVLVGTTVVIESIFDLPGVGNLLISSIYNRDLPVVQGLVVVLAIVVVLANTAADLLNSVLDPRVRHGRAFS